MKKQAKYNIEKLVYLLEEIWFRGEEKPLGQHLIPRALELEVSGKEEAYKIQEELDKELKKRAIKHGKDYTLHDTYTMKLDLRLITSETSRNINPEDFRYKLVISYR